MRAFVIQLLQDKQKLNFLIDDLLQLSHLKTYLP